MKKILVVDDDTAILSVMTAFLNRRGFDVLTLSSGLNIRETVTTYQPNLILLDVLLPGKQGTEICKELKEIFSIPIILYSAHADRKAVLKASGADEFIEKPFELTSFFNLINLHIS